MREKFAHVVCQLYNVLKNSAAQTEVEMMTSLESYVYGDISELNSQPVILPYKVRYFPKQKLD